jgi:hypothetical protein
MSTTRLCTEMGMPLPAPKGMDEAAQIWKVEQLDLGLIAQQRLEDDAIQVAHVRRNEAHCVTQSLEKPVLRTVDNTRETIRLTVANDFIAEFRNEESNRGINNMALGRLAARRPAMIPRVSHDLRLRSDFTDPPPPGCDLLPLKCDLRALKRSSGDPTRGGIRCPRNDRDLYSSLHPCIIDFSFVEGTERSNKGELQR